MPLTPEEPQIHESAQGPRASAATGRPAPTPRPVPGPRSAASPRPGRPVPGPAKPAAPARQPHPEAVPSAAENRSGEPSEPQLQLIPAPVDGALDAAEEALDLLLETGRAPGEVLVLTTGDLHPWAAHELSFGEASYWAHQDTDDDVFFAHATAVERAKARPVVIVALNGGDDQAVARVLPLARARASALLVVCGDSQLVTTLLGASAAV
ncbi:MULTISPECIES: hypothetical protein [unclassified Streptomyces]|uniref:hypothetical protein n=1 Tax=unclassified Streptomyces TaxID=2593676 RepID=UPI00166167C4|nr:MULTISPECIES: hypothetical protein [unclassified Streptomyces]MBD0707699.1 hypothetical protein [Streptomyces sp. CBMA291]MBD0714966.1 hypothetical protein [Streptomyces sp. CBMA370]